MADIELDSKTNARGDPLERASLYGIVQAVDTQCNKLLIKTRKGEVKELTLNSETRVTSGDERKPINLADLKSADRLTIHFEGNVVKRIHFYRIKGWNARPPRR